MIKFLYIDRLVTTILLLLLLALAPAMAQTVVYTGQTTPLEVEQKGYDTYKWELYSDPTVNFATTEGDPSPMSYAEFVGANTGATVNVLWKKPGIYFYKVTAYDVAGCTMNLKVGIIEVKIAVTAQFAEPDPKEICAGDPVTLSVTFTGTAPWSFTYSIENSMGTTQQTVTGITESPYPLMVSPAPTITTRYTVISVSDLYGTNTAPSNTVEQIVHPLPVPTTIYHR